MLKKFLIGTFVVALMFVGALALTEKASAAPQAIVTVADIQYAATVKLGSSGQAALIWQNFLNGYSTTANLVADGKFGPLSTVQAKAWQVSRGLVGDGVLGAMSRASAMAQITSGTPASAFPAGCTSTVGYSSVTGLACATVTTLPAGCTTTAGYSSTTGAKCSSSVSLPAGCTTTAGYSTTTGAACSGGSVSTNTGPLAGGAGDVAITKTTTDVESVAIEGQATQIYGFKAEASDSDVAITNVKVTLENTDAPTTSYRLSNYVDSVDIMMGSTKVGSADAADFTKTGYVYTKSIALSNAIVRMGASKKATFYVVVNAASSIDSTAMAGATWDITVDNIRFQDATGVIMTNNDTPTLSTFTFDSLAGSGDVKLTISKDSNNSPVAGTVEVSSTGSTPDLLMNQFKLKATGSDLSFDQITFAVDAVMGTDANPITDMVQGLELRNGSDVLASDPIFCTALGCTGGNIYDSTTDAVSDITHVKFILDSTYTISQDSTDTFGVYAKIAKTTAFTSGSLKVSLAANGIATEDSNGDTTGITESGSATGTIQTFSASGIVVGTYSWAVNATGTALDFFFTVDNSAGDANFDVVTADVNDALAVGNTGTVRTDAAGFVSDIKGVVTWYSGDAVTDDGSTLYTVAAGDTATFRVRYSLGATVNTAITSTQNGQSVEVLVNSVAGETVSTSKVHSPTATVNL